MISLAIDQQLALGVYIYFFVCLFNQSIYVFRQINRSIINIYNTRCLLGDLFC